LNVVPSTTYEFTTWVIALRSLDGKDGVIFHNFTLAVDRFVPLLAKNLTRGMTEIVVREEIETLKVLFPEFTHLRSGRYCHDPAKPPPHPTSFIIGGEA